MTVTLSHYIDSTNPSIRFEKVSDPDTDLFVWATVGYPKNYATKVSNPDTDLFVWATVGYPASLSENLTQTPYPHTVLAVIGIAIT